MFLLSSNPFSLHNSLLPCKAAHIVAFKKDLMCRAVDATQTEFSTSALPPAGLEVGLNLQLGKPRAGAPTLTLTVEHAQTCANTTLMRRVWIRGLHADRKTAMSVLLQLLKVFVEPKDEKGVRVVMRMRERGEEGGRYGLTDSYLISASVFHST